MRLKLDLETYNDIDINDPRYHDTAEIILFIYGFGDEPAKCWDITSGASMPRTLRSALELATQGKSTVYHFNGRPFDMRIIRNVYNLRVPEINQVDIREVAIRYGFPGSLAKLTAAVGLSEDEAKDKRGGYLIDLFCQPLVNIKAIKKDAPYDLAFIKSLREAGKTRCMPADAPEMWQEFIEYGCADVDSMWAAYKRLPDWNNTDKEQVLCAINHRINERGIRVDVDYARRMAELVAEGKQATADAVMSFTDGIKVTSRAKFLAWLKKQMPDRDIINTKKDTIERLQKEGDLPPVVEKVFELYGQSSSSSTAKYQKMVDTAHPANNHLSWYIDIRGAYTTGRYGARGGVQVHNFPRPKILPWVIESQREAVMAGAVPRNLLKHAPCMLRQSLVPDPGHVFVNADLSAIEGRTMAWGSGFTEQVSDYANGVNAYFANGPMFGMTYEQTAGFKDSSDPVEYGMYMLCLHPDTLVITSNGDKKITDVTTEDKLWDGQEWVSHQGLSMNGVKKTISVDGVLMTPNHLVNVKGEWIEARTVALNENLLGQSKETGSNSLRTLKKSTLSTSLCSAVAEQNHTASFFRILSEDCLKDACVVRLNGQAAPTDATTCLRTLSRGSDCCPDCKQLSGGAITQPTGRTLTTVAEEYMCVKNGVTATHISSNTSLLCQDGIIQNTKWTAPITAKDTNQAISGSYQKEKTSPTGEWLETCSKESTTSKDCYEGPVYDLINAGPRNCFTVRSDSGALVVHNCKVSELSMLYYGGVTALVGMGRNYGMNMAKIADMLYAEGLIPAQKMYEAEKCWNFVRLTARGRNAVDATRLTKQQWKVLDAVKRLWRDRHQPVVSFWYEIQRSLLHAWLNPETPVDFGFEGRFSMQFMGDWFGIRLPSGRILSYFGASVGGAEKAERMMDPDWKPEDEEEMEDDPTDRPVLLYHAFDSSGFLNRKPQIAHSGVIANNINQGFAASILDEGLIRADAEGWNPVIHIHGQILCQVRVDDQERTPKALEDLMCRPNDFAPGLPLKAQGERIWRFAK